MLGVAMAGGGGLSRVLGDRVQVTERAQPGGKEVKPGLTGHYEPEQPGILAGAMGHREWGERPGCGLWDTRVQVPDMELFQGDQGQVFPELWCGG